MENIVLFGCGEHARMVIDNIEEQNKYTLVGLLTNNDSELNQHVYDYKVIGRDSDIFQIMKDNPNITGYFLGIGNMKIREKIADWMQRNVSLKAVNIIHPKSNVSKYATIGYGNIFEAYSKIANGAVVGNHCIVNSFSAINHDQIIGNNVLIAGNVSMAGKSIGDNTIIADGASIGFKRNIGANCIIGDGAVVTQDIAENTIAYGNPARAVRKNN